MLWKLRGAVEKRWKEAAVRHRENWIDGTAIPTMELLMTSDVPDLYRESTLSRKTHDKAAKRQ